MKFVKSFILVLALLFASNTAAFSQAAVAAQTVKAASITTSIKVNGIGCASDIKSISKNIAAIKGVNTCELGKKGATSIFNVSFDPAVASVDEIHAAIEGTPGCKNPADRPYKVKN